MDVEDDFVVVGDVVDVSADVADVVDEDDGLKQIMKIEHRCKVLHLS